MPTKTNYFYLTLILVLAIILRFFSISGTPALNPDEAALGYNAYSLIQTGKDEHGVSWPLHFKSFGDYKPGGYVYLTIPFVYFLGLNEVATRLPNLILSIFAIYFFYKLVKITTKNEKLSLISMFVLTVSPWHIHFSRGAWEAGVALSFIIIGTFYFYKSLENRTSQNFLIFVLFYVLSLYTYHSARLIAPLLALSLLVLNFNYFFKNYKKILLPVLIGILITIPVLISFAKNGGTKRFGGVGITADQGPVWRANELINHHNNVKLINRAMHNKKVLYLISWGQKYTSHFDLNYLFVNGDEVPRSKIPDMGQLYLIELPLLLIGIFFVLNNKNFKNKFNHFIISFLFIAPIASSLTFQAPSALRSLPLVIPFSFIIACGIFSLFEFIPNKFKTVSLVLITSFYIYSITYYLDSYFIHYNKRLPTAWSYKFPELVTYLESEKNNYDKIYVTDKYDQPYIMFLFYSKYNPSLIQKEIRLSEPDKYGFSTVRHYDKYFFDKIDIDNIKDKSLIISSDEKVPLSPIKTYNFPDGKAAFNIYIK